MDSHSQTGSRSFVEAFTALMRLPRTIWLVIGVFVVDSMAYFGMLTLMTSYVSGDLRLGDARAGFTVSMFTMLVTLLMLGLGSVVEAYGLRRAIVFALLLACIGRIVYSAAPWFGYVPAVVVAVILSLVLVASGSHPPTIVLLGRKAIHGCTQPFHGLRPDHALMNLGIVAVGGLSAWIRPGFSGSKMVRTCLMFNHRC
jgi:dipeptide/tripeptide permease